MIYIKSCEDGNYSNTTHISLLCFIHRWAVAQQARSYVNLEVKVYLINKWTYCELASVWRLRSLYTHQADDICHFITFGVNSVLGYKVNVKSPAQITQYIIACTIYCMYNLCRILYPNCIYIHAYNLPNKVSFWTVAYGCMISYEFSGGLRRLHR